MEQAENLLHRGQETNWKTSHNITMW